MALAGPARSRNSWPMAVGRTPVIRALVTDSQS